jgi:hypothetical protein
MDIKILRQRIIFRRLIQALVILTIFLMALTRINHENDLFWQMKMGEDIVVRHIFPTTDPYNLSNPGTVWTLEEWLPSVSFYIIFTHFGAPGLIIYKAVIISITFFLFMVLFNWKKVNLYLSLIVLFLAAMVNTRGIWGVFPSIFEYLFIVSALLLLENYREKKTKRIPIILVALSFLWVESHASFFLLTAIIGTYLFGDIAALLLTEKFKKYKPEGGLMEPWQRLSLFKVFLITFITPFIHPNGWWMFAYPFRISFGKFTSYVSEYQKLWNVWNWNFSDFIHGFTVILMTILGVILIFSWRRVHIRDMLLALVFSVLALTAVRHVAIFALVALFVISRYITVWFGEYRGIFKRSLVKDIVVILFIVIFVIFYKSRLVPFGWEWSEEGYPKEAAEVIAKNKIQGNMFNHYNYGGYLIWKMPGYKVFIDGRLEMYEGQAGDDYLTILYANKGYKELLEKYKINFFICYVRDPIIEMLIDDQNWKYAYNDSDYVVYVKNNSLNKAFLAKYWVKKKEDDFEKTYKGSVATYRAEEAHKRGLEALKKKDFFGALYFFQQAVNLDPKFTMARYDLATLYVNIGSIESAVRELEEILRLDPDNLPSRKSLEKIDRTFNREKN